MFSYGQYCPVAKSAEILGERWTVLVVREMTFGVHRFADLRRGLPGISRSVLTERLRRLEALGVLERRVESGGRAGYYLTEAGQDLKNVVRTMGNWAARWVLSDPTPQDTDPDLMLMAISRRIDLHKLPARRTVVEFDIRGTPRPRRYWLVLEARDVSLCLKPTGFDTDLVVRADAGSLYRVYMGRLEYSRALATGQIQLEGPRTLARAFPKWMLWSLFADTVRASASR